MRAKYKSRVLFTMEEQQRIAALYATTSARAISDLINQGRGADRQVSQDNVYAFIRRLKQLSNKHLDELQNQAGNQGEIAAFKAILERTLPVSKRTPYAQDTLHEIFTHLVQSVEVTHD